MRLQAKVRAWIGHKRCTAWGEVKRQRVRDTEISSRRIQASEPVGRLIGSNNCRKSVAELVVCCRDFVPCSSNCWVPSWLSARQSTAQSPTRSTAGGMPRSRRWFLDCGHVLKAQSERSTVSYRKHHVHCKCWEGGAYVDACEQHAQVYNRVLVEGISEQHQHQHQQHTTTVTVHNCGEMTFSATARVHDRLRGGRSLPVPRTSVPAHDRSRLGKRATKHVVVVPPRTVERPAKLPRGCVVPSGRGGGLGDCFYSDYYLDDAMLAEIQHFSDGCRCLQSSGALASDHFRLFGERAENDPPILAAKKASNWDTCVEVLGWYSDTVEMTIRLPVDKLHSNHRMLQLCPACRHAAPVQRTRNSVPICPH